MSKDKLISKLIENRKKVNRLSDEKNNLSAEIKELKSTEDKLIRLLEEKNDA